MKKKKILLVVLLIPFILLLGDYVNFRMMKIENEYYNDFKDKLYKTVQKDQSFNLNDVTPFKWDKMYIIPPYTSKPKMEEIVGERWTTSKTYLGYLLEKTTFGKYPLVDDSLHKLVFTKEEEILLDITLSRMKIDFTKVRGVVSSNDSELLIKKKGKARIILENPGQ